MRYARLMPVLLALAATLYAADPFAATWKMNTAKTKYAVGNAPKEQTVVITETGTDLTVKITGAAADGTKIALGYVVPAAGGSGKINGVSPYDGVTSKRLAPTEREISYMKAGKAVYMTHSKISADGNSLSVSVKGSNVLGQAVEGVVVYDKQK